MLVRQPQNPYWTQFNDVDSRSFRVFFVKIEEAVILDFKTILLTYS